MSKKTVRFADDVLEPVNTNNTNNTVNIVPDTVKSNSGLYVKAFICVVIGVLVLYMVYQSSLDIQGIPVQQLDKKDKFNMEQEIINLTNKQASLSK